MKIIKKKLYTSFGVAFLILLPISGCNYMPEISMPSLSIPAVVVEPEVEPELCQIGENVFVTKGEGDCPQYPAEG